MIQHRRPDYRPPESPTGWHDQDWLLILVALDWYARDGPDDVTDGQELRAYQLVESIAQLHGTVSLGSVRFLDNSYFDQYAREGTITEDQKLRVYQLIESIARHHTRSYLVLSNSSIRSTSSSMSTLVWPALRTAVIRDHGIPYHR